MNDATEKFPLKTALRHTKLKIDFTFEELKKHSEDFARNLVDYNFKPGDTLAIWLPNSAEHLVAQFACAKVGVKIAGIDPTITKSEHIEYILRDSECRAILFHPKLNGVTTTPILQDLLPELQYTENPYRPLKSRKFKKLRTLFTTEQEYYMGIFQFRHSLVADMIPNPLDKLEPAVTPETPLVFTYTNAGNEVTLPKKSEVLTHGDVVRKAEDLVKRLELTSSDKVCFGDPILAFSTAALACVKSNAQIVISSWEHDEEAFEKTLKEQNCNMACHSDENIFRI